MFALEQENGEEVIVLLELVRTMKCIERWASDACGITIVCLLLLLAACNSETMTPEASPTMAFSSPVSASPTPMLAFDRYTTTMELLDAPYRSPDGKFVFVCGSYGSTPCHFYRVCNLVRHTCSDDFVGILLTWHPERPHTLVYFYQSVYLGEPDRVVMLDHETGSAEVFPEACPDWYHQLYPWPCDELPTAIVGGKLESWPDGSTPELLIHNLNGENYFGPMTLLKEGPWIVDLKNSPGKLYEVTVAAEGYTGIPLSYTIQVSGTKAYVLDAGRLTGEVADHLDFRFEKSK